MTKAEYLRKYYEKHYKDQHVPFCIERIDGQRLLLNNDFETYSFEAFQTDTQYTFERLFADPRVEPGDFKVISWAPIKNLFEHPEKYFSGKHIVCNYRNKLNE